MSLRRVQWAAEEQAESGRKRAPAGPEKVLSDADADQLKKQQEKTDGSEHTDAEPGRSVGQEGQKSEAEPTDAPEAEVTEDSLQTDRKAQAPQESEQAEVEQQSTDTESQTGDDSSAQPEKTEQA